ncbi:signal transduction histidine kinase [Hamadaea flava]|uniref:histidine kinase n=1 Tax=Hamadaea flava TaxID=1742688 RepID=A0ABV8LRK0_9ACTN|nr:HAMP domain-containing sensor histidine kinase [Hamadaea flava]MCP2322995.1 signal transduction histidine kinase [Hamadaea flava]
MTPRHRLRRRFTVLYGVMAVLSGVILLGIVFVLAQDLPPADAPAPAGAPPAGSGPMGVPPAVFLDFRADLVLVCGIALAIMAVLSLGLGWLYAGRMLRPVRQMTGRLQQISGSNVHERLALAGPRDEFTELGDTIDGLLARLEAALDGQKRFVANAAHELRTPLTVEHALIEEPLIDPDATVEAYRANFERLLAVNRQRGRLLESLLTLASSEHGRGPGGGPDHAEPVDLAAIVTRAIEDRTRPAELRGLRIKSSVRPARLVGDPALLARLVANLCDNAFHYNVAGGVIEVATRTDTGLAVLVVSNTGPVIPPDEVQRLFEPFQRLHRIADDDRHGLGLSIVRAIVAAHDGQLTASARPGGGLMVEIAFPSAEPADQLSGP